MEPVSFLAGVVVGVAGVSLLLLVVRFFRPFLYAKLSAAPVSMATIVGMRLRGHDPKFLIDAYVKLVQTGHETSISVVESCYIANKNRITDVDTLAGMVPEYDRKMKEKTRMGN
jgi:uncharacterized protein YqfA (UPF0365 family)